MTVNKTTAPTLTHAEFEKANKAREDARRITDAEKSLASIQDSHQVYVDRVESAKTVAQHIRGLIDHLNNDGTVSSNHTKYLVNALGNVKSDGQDAQYYMDDYEKRVEKAKITLESLKSGVKPVEVDREI